MALIEIRSPSSRDLAWFGFILLLVSGVAGSVVFWKIGSSTGATVVWVVGVALVAVYYAVPAIQRRLYMTWMYAAFPIGWVVSHLLFAAIYYGVITPIGLLVRLMSHDPLQRQFDASAKTYWVAREPREGIDQYFKQF